MQEWKLEKTEWEPYFKEPRLKPLFLHRERNLDDDFYRRFFDEGSSKAGASILQQMISIEREAYFSVRKKITIEIEEGLE